MYAPDILAVAAAFEKYHIRIFVCVFFEIFVIVPGDSAEAAAQESKL